MLNLDNPEDREFIRFVWARLPIGLLFMEYQDYLRLKAKEQVKERISNAEINKLSLTLEINNFTDLINGEK
jgi:hypothetical protein